MTGVSQQATFSVTYPAVPLTGGLTYYFTYNGDAVYAANTSDPFAETVSHTVPGATVVVSCGVEAGTVQPEIWKLVEW